MLANHAQTRAHTHTTLRCGDTTNRRVCEEGEFGFGAICHPYARRGNTRKIENLISKTAHTRHRSARAPNRHPTLTRTPTSWCVCSCRIYGKVQFTTSWNMHPHQQRQTRCALLASRLRLRVFKSLGHSSMQRRVKRGPADQRHLAINTFITE